MPSDMRELFEAEAPSIPVSPPDLPGVIGEGHKRVRRRRVASFSSAVVVLGVIAVGVTQFAGEERLPVGPRPNPSASVHELVIEEISERDRAEIFAFRALAEAGLMEPYAIRRYSLSNEDDTTRTDNGWRIGLAATGCEPTEGSFKCKGLSGEDPELGFPIADTYITVILRQGEWRVVDVGGNMLGPERERVIGYALQDREEESHWEFPAVSVQPSGAGTTVTMLAVWVGPNPTSAPGSVCVLETFNEQGSLVGEPDVFYQEPPPKWFDTAGFARGVGVGPKEGIAEAIVECHQYSGAGWEVTSEPHLVGDPGKVIGVSADLTWRGDEGVTTAAVCRATLLDAAGDQVAEGTRKVTALWRPGELKDYPYRSQVFVSTGPPMAAESIGEFTCESR